MSELLYTSCIRFHAQQPLCSAWQAILPLALKKQDLPKLGEVSSLLGSYNLFETFGDAPKDIVFTMNNSGQVQDTGRHYRSRHACTLQNLIGTICRLISD